MGQRTTQRRAFLSSTLAGVRRALAAGFHIPDERERATDALTAEAQRQIALQYETADAQDIKTLGIVAASIATGAFVASSWHNWLSVEGVPVWIVPLLFEGLAIGAFVLSLWQKKFRRGARVPWLYRHYGGTMIETKGLILRELVAAIEHNRALLRPKALRYAVGCWLLAGAAVTTGIALILSRV
jgi:hypothetical protein